MAILVVLIPGIAEITHSLLVVGALIGGVAVTAAGVLVPWSRLPAWAPVLVPLADLLLIGALRAGTGGSGPVLHYMVALPVVWVASLPGRRLLFAVLLVLSLTRFFRATTATRNAVPGIGLGMSITHVIAVAHGGTVEVQSTEGVGTTFSLLLPLLD